MRTTHGNTIKTKREYKNVVITYRDGNLERTKVIPSSQGYFHKGSPTLVLMEQVYSVLSSDCVLLDIKGTFL